jgi:hypothetical protein
MIADTPFAFPDGYRSNSSPTLMAKENEE